MLDRTKLTERIKKKEQEINELEIRLREERSYIQALQDIAKMLSKESISQEEHKHHDDEEDILREGSSVALARDFLAKRGKSAHISVILIGIGKDINRQNRASVGGSLSAYVRRNEIFTRTGPNRFGLTTYPKITDEAERDNEAEDKPVEPEMQSPLPPPPPRTFGGSRLAAPPAPDLDDDIPL